MLNIKRALISVYDKTGILEFAQFLVSHGVELISTGGTYKFLKANNLQVTEISQVTNFKEMLDGRVKTLHPNIHGGILAIRNNPEHMKQVQDSQIQLIDMVIVNLYPFFNEVTKDISFEEKIEFIDIGGPSMLRSAAKAFSDVIVISSIQDYEKVQNELTNNQDVSHATKKNLAGKVFNLTSAYDAAIANFLLEDKFPEYLSLSYTKEFDLRYGENPHQNAAYYTNTTEPGCMKNFIQLHGKELSFNNIRDMDLAWQVVSEFDEIACCGVKHSTPCAVAIGSTASEAYSKMFNADSVSIFGGIVAINSEVDASVANAIGSLFLEIIVAASFSTEALEILKSKKNLRLIKLTNIIPSNQLEYLTVDGGILVQETNRSIKNDLKVVTNLSPTDAEVTDLIIALKVVKHTKSNAIVVVKDGVTQGIGTGQTNRIAAVNHALINAQAGSVLASDAFFPFRDCVDACAQSKVRAIIQPGGSLRDQESIDACNELGLAMIFIGFRHFKH